MGSDWVILITFSWTALIASNIAVAMALVRARKRIRELERHHTLQPGSSERLEEAMEAIAIEVERISEGQRFTTKLLAERRDATPEIAPLRATERIVTPH
jgi:hypothetical protein